MRAAPAAGLQLRQPEAFGAYVDAVFQAMWVKPSNLGDSAELADPEVKARLTANTNEAVARGVFGAPTCFVGEAMFFGQDRLDFVREALR